MSESESSDSDKEDFSSSFKNLRGALRKLDQEIGESIESLQRIRRTVKHTEKHTSPPDVTAEYPGLQKYLARWKKENRLNHNGSKVLLTKKEARRLFKSTHSPSGLQPSGLQPSGLQPEEAIQSGLNDEGDTWISIYRLCEHLKN